MLRWVFIGILAQAAFGHPGDDFSHVYKAINPSVVFITSHLVGRQNASTSNAPEVQQRFGAGCVWCKDGQIVTNYHVISDALNINVTFADGNTYKAEVVGSEKDMDVAVLNVDAPKDKLIPIPLGVSGGLESGQKVCIIGHPLGFSHSFKAGHISYPSRPIQSTVTGCLQDAIETNFSINPGNSGGPLLDRSGFLIGIVTSGVKDLGFSMPVDKVRSFVDKLLKPGKEGLSGKDLSNTTLSLAPPDLIPEDSNRPGLDSVDDDDSIGRLSTLQELVMKNNLKLISIDDLIRETGTSVERSSTEPMNTKDWDRFQAYYYRTSSDVVKDIAMVKGDIGDGQNILVSVHSHCPGGELFRSFACDCRKQMSLAMREIKKKGQGVFLYLYGHKERGVVREHKSNALQQKVLFVDSLEYAIGAQILLDLGVRTMMLMTHNLDPATYTASRGQLTGKRKAPLPGECSIMAEEKDDERDKDEDVKGSDG